ncbi:MAG TPA: hypothetical protein PKC21_07820 [Oligoflexia bacterium]|nr:hypothetical protein [Oligoflexia bacterium]HMR25245.1 hypothetical protein [Oligoflexia bacterium]
MKRIVLVLMVMVLASNVYAQRRSTRWSNISKSKVNLTGLKAPSIFAFAASDPQNKRGQSQSNASFNIEINNAEASGFQLVALNVCNQGSEEKCQSLSGSYEQRYTNNNMLLVTVDYEVEVCQLQEDGTQRYFQFIFSDDQNTNYQPLIYTICD